MTRISLALFLGLATAMVVPACGSNHFGAGDGGDDAMFGSDVAFGSDGTSNGDGNGLKGCDPSCLQVGGVCQANVCVITDNSGNVPSQTQTQLEGGGTADSAFAWLYPYDKTIFPRGLLSPALQFAGTSANDVYVHITASSLDYQGFYVPASGPLQVTVAAPMWTAITLAIASSKDPVKVEVTKLFNSAVSGPVTETWNIAQGSLRGTIYYETYDSQILGGAGSVGIMKIQPGAKTPTQVLSGCGNVCHTASADGSTLVANAGFFLASASYDLKNNASLVYGAPNTILTYGGIYPDGSISMSATHYRTWIPGAPSRLYNTKTGANIAAPGWDNVITNAGTPAFSPDGKKLAFIHEDTTSGHTLSVMDFNLGTHTFSNLVDLATDPNYVGWPAFTPDSKYVVYHSGSNAQFETDNGATGDVLAVEIATKTVHRLDALDGYTGSSTATYLPANDPNLSFAPTVLPEAVGGFFWVVFTSHRSYGNILPSQDHGDEYGKLWVSALDIGTAPGVDGSHPAFFLDGQEHTSDNLRGFWVLDPCKADGQSCTSGDQCCDGYCRGEDGGPLVCVPPPGGCSQEYEKCTTGADCCNTNQQCINNHCATVVN